jgi:ParB family chromosome partitioning protein
MPAEQVYQIITGERRYRAAILAGLAEMPCWLQSPENRQILVRQIVENWQRTDLHPFDLADTLVQLRDQQQYSQKEIAGLTGKPESEISKILSLLKLNPLVQRKYRQDRTGTLSRRHLESVAKLPEGQQIAFHDEVVRQGLTVKETEQRVQEAMKGDEVRKKQGAPLGTKRKIVTPKGTVVVMLRRKTVNTGDIIELLDLAKRQLVEELGEGN